jgi:hypothetical protein
MRFSGPGLLALLPLLLAGVGPRPDQAPGLSAESLGPAVFFSGPRQSIPQPVHNEATCAFCQVVAFTPYAARPADRLPDQFSIESPEHLSSDDRLIHSESSSPHRSRAPPLLRAS